MNKSTIIKSLFNGIASFIVIAMVQNLIKGIPFEQAIASPYTILIAISAVVGSLIGFTAKAIRQ